MKNSLVLSTRYHGGIYTMLGTVFRFFENSCKNTIIIVLGTVNIFEVCTQSKPRYDTFS